MNKRQLLKIGILILGVAAALFVTKTFFKLTMESVKIGPIGKINAITGHSLDAELTIWGASTAYINFNPKRIQASLNLEAFNMGLDGTNIDQYGGLLEEFISYTQKSKFIIIAFDVHGGLAKRKGIYELHNWVHHVDNDHVYRYLYNIDPYLIFKARYIPFYSLTLYNKHSFHFAKAGLLNPSERWDYPDLGFNPLYKRMDENLNEYGPVFSVEINQEVVTKVKEICIEASQKNIRVAIVITPCYNEGLCRIKNANDFVEKINSLTGATVYNFLSTSISDDAENFNDNTHLTVKGSDKLTDLLISKLKIDFFMN